VDGRDYPVESMVLVFVVRLLRMKELGSIRGTQDKFVLKAYLTSSCLLFIPAVVSNAKSAGVIV
jgi:hypothetical protein